MFTIEICFGQKTVEGMHAGRGHVIGEGFSGYPQFSRKFRMLIEQAGVHGAGSNIWLKAIIDICRHSQFRQFRDVICIWIEPAAVGIAF